MTDPDPPGSRRRGPALVPLALVLVAVAGLSACGAASGGGPQTYRAHGVSFEYPAGWQRATASDVSASVPVSPGRLWSAIFHDRQNDAILVVAFPQTPPVTAANLATLTPVFGQQMRQAMSRGHVAIQAGPDRIAIGGMPALEVWTAGPTPRGVQVETTSVFAFDGATEYYASCQHTPKKATQVARACGQLMRTFTVSGIASQPGPAAPLSPRAFAAKASGVCVRADQQTPQLPTGHSPLAAANAFGKAARLTDGMLAGFAALEPPAAWQYPFGEFAAHLGQIRDGYTKLTAVMRQGDFADARSQFRAASTVMSRSSRLDGLWLRRHGMRACTTVRFLH